MLVQNMLVQNNDFPDAHAPDHVKMISCATFSGVRFRPSPACFWSKADRDPFSTE